MIIEGINIIYKTFISTGKALTHSTKYGKDIVRKYNTPLLKRVDIIELVDTVHALRRNKWKNLSDVEKEEWNTLAERAHMTGFELYDQEGFKELVNSNLKKCKVGTARLGGSILPR